MQNSGTEKLRFQQTIGSGTFGKVKRAVHLPTNKKVAVKILNKHQIETKKDALRIKRQIAILKRVNHPNLLKLLQIIQTSQSYFLITRLVQGEELYQLINRRGFLEQQQAAELFVQLLDAMIHLKKQGVVHRDLKPENIIITNGKLTLIDFGLGYLCEEGQRLKTSCGSPCYAAPEMMSGKSYDPQKTEIWALGITLYAMLCGNLPFQESEPNQLYKLMMLNRYQQPPQITPELKNLLRGMIESKPGKRLNLKQITEHKWVRAQQHQFFDESHLSQWDQRLLSKMQKKFGFEREILLQKIKSSFGEESITYWLCSGQEDYDSQLSLHNGPINLRYVFKTLALANQFIAKEYPQFKNLSEYKKMTNEFVLDIKKLGGGLFYVCSIQNN